MGKKPRKTRSDKGKKRPNYPKERKKARPSRVKSHTRGGPLIGDLWGADKSRAVWERVNEELDEGKSISRASIILFLEKMEEQGVLGSRDATGKGGHHKIYHPLI